MTLFDSKLEKLSTQLAIPATPAVYGWWFTAADGKEYRYVGETGRPYKSRRRDYITNMRLIRDGCRPRSDGKYRAVHFALYTALKEDWDIFNPWWPCSTKQEAEDLETRFIFQFKCNLNKKYNCLAKGWCIEDLDNLTMESFVV